MLVKMPSNGPQEDEHYDRLMQEHRSGNLQFPWKLHLLLSHAEKNGLDHIVSWMPDGRSFKIHNKNDFVSELMATFFATSKFKSFQRSLNLWGFEAFSYGPGKGCRFHKYFVKSKPNFCRLMTRVKVKSIAGRSNTSYNMNNKTYTSDAVPSATSSSKNNSSAAALQIKPFLPLRTENPPPRGKSMTNDTTGSSTTTFSARGGRSNTLDLNAALMGLRAADDMLSSVSPSSFPSNLANVLIRSAVARATRTKEEPTTLHPFSRENPRKTTMMIPPPSRTGAPRTADDLKQQLITALLQHKDVGRGGCGPERMSILPSSTTATRTATTTQSPRLAALNDRRTYLLPPLPLTTDGGAAATMPRALLSSREQQEVLLDLIGGCIFSQDPARLPSNVPPLWALF